MLLPGQSLLTLHSRRLRSAIALAVRQILDAGRRGVVPGSALNADGTGNWWLDRNRTIPFDPATDQEVLTGVQYIDDLTGLPVGWALGVDLLGGAGAFTGSANPAVWNLTSTGAGGVAAYDATAQALSLLGTGAQSGLLDTQIGAPIAVVPGRRYVVSFRSTLGVTSARAGSVGGSADLAIITGVVAGWRSFNFVASTSSAFLRFAYSGTTATLVDDITVREVIRDESWMGANFATNGGFDSDTAWGKGAGWTISGGVANAVSSPSGAFVSQTKTEYVSGKTYLVSFDVVSCSAGGFAFRFEGQIGATKSTPGTYYEVFASTGATQNLGVRTVGTTTGSIDNITIREIPGNPIVAAVANLGPIPTRRVNLLQRTEDFSHSAWASVASGVTFAGLVANFTTPAGSFRYQQITTPYLVGSAFRVRVKLSSPSGKAAIGLRITNSAGTDAAALSVSLTSTPTYYELTHTFTSTGAAVQVGLDNRSLASANTTPGEVVATDWDFRPVYFTATNFPAIPAYQRVGDGTAGVFDYDHVEFPQLLKQNSTPSAALMTLGTVDMSAGDAGAILANVVKTSDASQAFIAEFAAGVSGTFAILGPHFSGSATFQARHAGTVNASTTPSVLPAPCLAALISSGDISADQNVLVVNGVAGTPTTADQGTGNLSNARFNIMGRDVGGTPSLRFSGMFVGGPPALVPADIGIDLLALSRALAAEGGYVY